MERGSQGEWCWVFASPLLNLNYRPALSSKPRVASRWLGLCHSDRAAPTHWEQIDLLLQCSASACARPHAVRPLLEMHSLAAISPLFSCQRKRKLSMPKSVTERQPKKRWGGMPHWQRWEAASLLSHSLCHPLFSCPALAGVLQLSTAFLVFISWKETFWSVLCLLFRLSHMAVGREESKKRKRESTEIRKGNNSSCMVCISE